MSQHLNKINESKHDFDDSNDSNLEIDFTDSNLKVDNNSEVDFNVSNVDDEDRFADQDRKLFMKSLVPVGNSFALAFFNSSEEQNFITYEGLSDDKVSDDFQRGITRSLNCMSQNVSSGINQGPNIIKKGGDDDQSIEDDNMAKDLDKKRKNDQDDSGQTRNIGSNNRSRLTKRRKNYQPKRWKIDGNGSERESSRIMEAQVNQGKSVENMRSSGTMEAPDGHGNDAKKVMFSCKLKTPDDQDHGYFNRSSGIRLRNYSEKEFDNEDGEVEACSGMEVEVLDKDPYAHTPVANSKVIDALV